jgi:predicted TIM-barrel fold metal-dependent hydrolase
MRIDVNAFLGRYPFRHAPGGSPQALLEAMDRIGVDQGWLSNLSAVFWKDPTEGNELLYSAIAQHPRLKPVPAAHPGLANWKDVVLEAVRRGAPALRADPTFYGIDPAGAAMQELVAGCGEAGLPLMLAVRFEDGRQRHPNDRADELPAHAVRALIRSHPRTRLIVTHAGREFIEQVHFGSTPAEAGRVLWDICWIWGPPEDDLAILIETIGVERFTFGTGMPLRLPENSVAKLDLLDQSSEDRQKIESGNLERFLALSS